MRNPSFAGPAAWAATWPKTGPNTGIALIALLVVSVSPQPAAAQGLLQSIFGFLSPKKDPAPAKIISRPDPALRDDNMGRTNPFQSQSPHQSYIPRRAGHLRTICVRLCDGYYFPISNSSSRRDFYRDAQACQSRCQSETRLYHMPAANPSIEYARDRRGFAYKDLKNAFLYRKKLSKSCTCRPEPWSVAERMRHKSYEIPEPSVVASLTEPDASGSSGSDENQTLPHLTDEGAPSSLPAPSIAVPRQPAPQFIATPARRPPPTYVTRSPVKKQPAMGLGASFGSGMPKVKYRHKWSDVLD